MFSLVYHRLSFASSFFNSYKPSMQTFIFNARGAYESFSCEAPHAVLAFASPDDESLPDVRSDNAPGFTSHSMYFPDGHAPAGMYTRNDDDAGRRSSEHSLLHSTTGDACFSALIEIGFTVLNRLEIIRRACLRYWCAYAVNCKLLLLALSVSATKDRSGECFPHLEKDCYRVGYFKY